MTKVRRHGPEVVALDVESDEVVGREGGFLAIRRLRLRAVRADGSRSAPMLVDFLARPKGIDAVVVAVWARVAGRVEVLLRDNLRPAIYLGRRDAALPIAEPARGLFVAEVVAGIIEKEDVGEAGVRRRAALEVAEEAGFDVDPAAIVMLGAGSIPSPGAMSEKFWMCAVEVDPAIQREPEGDGSPMEEGSRSWWRELDDAIAACVAGEIEDCKTELVLRRLRDHLR